MKIKVLNLSALSYSGTTWLNLLLGSHDDVFTIGPPHKLWEAKDKSLNNACLVHGNTCTFWNQFESSWDRTENFFIALQKFSGKSIFVMDNAPQDFIEQAIQHPEIEALSGRYIRDARAITASYARKMASSGTSYIESIQPDGWFYPSFQAIPDLKKMNQEKQLVVRYEDAVNDQAEFLKKAGDFLGIEYTEASYRFWEWDHHITSGNQGPIAMIKLHQNLPVGNFESKATYQEQLDRLKINPTKAFSDERWKTQLNKEDLDEFDRLMGKKNGELGYQRSNSVDTRPGLLTRLKTQLLG